jgi:hypothetical protein
VGLALFAVLGLVFIWVVRALPHIALAQIGELTNTRIDSESVDLNFNGSIVIKKLVIRPERQQTYDDAILKAETVYARFSIGSLLLLGPHLKELRVNEFVFDVQHDLDTGAWNVAALKIKVPKEGHGRMPLVILKNGKLQYSKVSGSQVKVAASVPIDARFEFDEPSREGYSFNLRTAQLTSGYGKSNLRGFWKPGAITVAGGISSQDIPAFERAWAIDVLAAELRYDRDRNYSLRLRTKDFHSTYSPAADTLGLVESTSLAKSGTFAALQRFFSRFQPSGTVDLEIKEASGNLDRLGDSTVVGKVSCKDVSACDRAFPYAIEHLKGQIDFTEKTAVLGQLSGQHGSVNITIDGLWKTLASTSQYQIHITSDNMALDNDLYDALGQKRKKLWAAFSPSGQAAIDYRLSRQPEQGKRETLAVQLLGAEAAYQRFPYPLTNLTGKLFFDREGLVVSDVVSQLGQRKITLNGNVTGQDTDRPVCYLSVKAENVPLDSTLAAALPARQRDLYSRFEMTGLADAQVKIFTPQEDPNSSSFFADVFLKKASLKVNKSPLVISDISASAAVTPASISIKDFTGQHGGGAVSLGGGIWLADKAELSRYHLAVTAKEIQLSGDLIGLLGGPASKTFSELGPEGKINLSADLSKTAGEAPASRKIIVDCLDDSINFRRFAYPLKNVTGRLTITNDKVILDNVTARPAADIEIAKDGSGIKLNGQIDLANNTFGQGRFDLSASDIPLDERLATALSERIAPFYRTLLPSGRFDLNSENIRIFSADDGARCIDFAGAIQLKKCGLDLSASKAELDALLNTNVLYKIGSGFSAGQVNLMAERLRVRGKSITNLKAEINYDPDRQSWLAENLIADCHGGRVIGTLEFKRPDHAALEYLLQVGFERVDLGRFLGDVESAEVTGSAATSGTMTGALSMAVRTGDSPWRIGRCRLAISDMKVGQLSPLAKLLYVLNLTEPKDFAFEQMVVDSYIKGDKLLFEKFDLSGQAIAFSGSGWMDLVSDNVDLVLTARGKRLAAAEPSVVQSLAEGLGQAVVRVEVTGNVHDPKVTTRTLPVIEDSLKILGTKRK